MTRRVALVSPYALSVFGGVQEQVLAMSRELARRGDEVLIVCPDEQDREHYDTLAAVARFGRVLSVPANGSRAPLTLSWGAARRARERVATFAPDVVHFHEPFAPLVGWGVLMAHAVPAVATFHRSGDGPALRLTRPWLGRLSRDLDVTAAVSPPAAETIHRATGLTPTVLFNGFEVDRFGATPRETTSEVVVLFVGRLEERKGAATLIDAVRTHNARDGAQWRLVVLGDGPQRERLEALAAHDGRVEFLGALGDEDKRRWLRRASVFVAPSLRGESFGTVLLEAMASETPVVASDITGYRDASGGHATLAPPGDAGALEHAIAAALQHTTSDSIAAAKAHAEHWSMSVLVDAYGSLYAEARERFRPAR